MLVYQFETITIKFESQQELSVSQKDILRFSHLRERFERQPPPSLYKALNSLLENGTSINDALAILERNYRYPIRRLVSSIDFEDMISQEHSRKQKTISEYLQNGFKDVLVLYLPTYRRIEQDLKKLHMIGFRAEYATGELKPDGDEVIESGWFDREHLPQIPRSGSIARTMLDAWVAAGN